jgi:hypothetical protein
VIFFFHDKLILKIILSLLYRSIPEDGNDSQQ